MNFITPAKKFYHKIKALGEIIKKFNKIKLLKCRQMINKIF